MLRGMKKIGLALLVGSRFTIAALGVAVEIGRAVGRRVTLIGTVAVTGSVATSAIPAPLSRGAVYRQLIASSG